MDIEIIPIIRFSGSLLLAVTIVLMNGQVASAAGNTSPDCWQEPRIYHPQKNEIDEQLFEIHRYLSVEKIETEFSDEWTKSPNNAYAYSHANEINQFSSIKIFNEKKYLLDLKLSEIKSISNIKWMNEKLLFFRIWLGRIAGIDVLFDVELEKVVYSEPVRVGSIDFQQFEEACNSSE